MSLYSRLDRLAVDVEKLDRKVDSVSNAPQSQRTSVEGGGSFDFNDADGNLKAIVGGQEDGGTTINVISGPTPPTPSGFTVDVDHGKFILHWLGRFDGDALAPSDWSRAEVHASQDQFFVPDRTTARGSIVSAAGGELTIGVLKGPWTIKMVAWSQAGKMSLPSAPVDVEVPGYGEIVLAEIDAAETVIKNGSDILVEAQDTLGNKLSSAFGRLDGIDVDLTDLGDAVQGAVESANGKNTVHFEDRPPTPADPGIKDDNWWVGQVGRNEVVEATNVLANPSFESGTIGVQPDTEVTLATVSTTGYQVFGDNGLIADVGTLVGTTTWIRSDPINILPGQWFGASLRLRSVSGSTDGRLRFQFHNSSGGFTGTPYVTDQMNVSGGFTEMKGTAQAPANTSYMYIYVYLYSSSGGQPAAGTRYNTDGWNAAIASTEASALSAVDTYFDGDTPDGTTDDESHYRWTGTPHASTSEKFLPGLDIGDSATWNVTEQYRHDGTEWKRVELSHEVISSLDVGKLVAGSALIKEAVIEKLFAEVVVAYMSIAEQFIGSNAILDESVTAPKIVASEELWAKLGQFVTVYAEMVDSDVFNGRVFRGSTFLTTNDSRWSDAGLFLNDADGKPRIQAPTDGSDFTVNAEVVAKSLTATGRASFLAENNRLEPGAGLVLAAGVGDPPSPPVVSTYYPTIKPPALTGGETISGLAYGDGLFWRAVDAGVGYDHLDRIEGIDSDGNVQRTIPLDLFWARNGLTIIGDEIFALGRRDDFPATTRDNSRWVRVFGLDGTYKRQWEYTATKPTYQPGIGKDENGNLVIAQCRASGALTWRTYSPKGNGTVLTTVEGRDNTAADISGVYIGSADYGQKRVIIAKDWQTPAGMLYPAFDTTGTYLPNDSWRTPGGARPTGIAWDGESFYGSDETGAITEYTTPSTGDNTNQWWAVYRWGKDLDVDGTMDQTSRISPPARFSWPRRARLKISAPNLPLGVGEIAPSIAQKATMPTRTDFHTPTWWSNTGTPIAYYYELPADWKTAGTPADGNNFPAADPATLQSANPGFLVKGDGSGRWGQLSFDTAGRVHGLTISGTIDHNNVPANGGIAYTTVTFPSGRFNTPPAVFAQATNGRVNTVVVDITTTSCLVRSWNFTDKAADTNSVTWTAIGGD